MFLLNLQGKEPIFEQIQTQILRFIKAGVLQEGDKLPSVRELAKDNGINPNTVAKAYTQLEQNGIVHNIPKKGVYVSKINTSVSKQDECKKVLQTFKETGFTKQEMIQIIEELFQEGNDAEN